MCALQSKQIDVQKMRYSRLVLQRVLCEMKWSSKLKHFVNRSGRRDLHFVAADLHYVAIGRQLAQSFCHSSESVIGVKKTARRWIDQSDSAGHVCQHFLIEDHFALEPLPGFDLPSIKPA